MKTPLGHLPTLTEQVSSQTLHLPVLHFPRLFFLPKTQTLFRGRGAGCYGRVRHQNRNGLCAGSALCACLTSAAASCTNPVGGEWGSSPPTCSRHSPRHSEVPLKCWWQTDSGFLKPCIPLQDAGAGGAGGLGGCAVGEECFLGGSWFGV